MYEQFMGDYTHRDSASRQVQLFISFANFRATSLVSISYFSTYSGIKNSLPYPKHMLRAHYISISLATVMGMFMKPIFYFAVRKFVCEARATTNIYGRKY